MEKFYRQLVKLGEYVDVSEASRVILKRHRRGRLELLIVTEGTVGRVEKPLNKPKRRDEE